MTTRVWHETPQPWRLSEYRDYRPISAYAMIGDLHTAALVGLNGSIDWCCLPHFDSPSVFAAMLDATRGGSFHIAPAMPHTSEQRYSPATNVLITTFSLDAGGVVELTDFMPITQLGTSHATFPRSTAGCGVRAAKRRSSSGSRLDSTMGRR